MKFPPTPPIDRFDYIAAYAQIVRELEYASNDESRGAALFELCWRVSADHGFEDCSGACPDWESAARTTLDIIRPHFLAQLASEKESAQTFVPAGGALFRVEHGWEADVYLSQRRSYLDSVLKIYRRHNLGSNPNYPGYGWAANTDEIERINSSNEVNPGLPEKLFTPADSIDKLIERFRMLGRCMFFAPIKSIWRSGDILCLEQERVLPLRSSMPSDIFYGASQFLTRHCGVFFNSPTIENAVIFHQGRYFLLQDYINNLAYRLDPYGNPDRSSPVIFDGVLLPLSVKLLQSYPCLAHAVLLISRRYSDVAQDREIIDAATFAASAGATAHLPVHPPPFLREFAPQWLTQEQNPGQFLPLPRLKFSLKKFAGSFMRSPR